MKDLIPEDSFDGNAYRDPYSDEPLAGGIYSSNTNLIMNGFRLFQRKYAMKNIVIQLVLLAIAVAVQIAALIIDRGAQSAWMVIGICVALGAIIVIRPRKTAKDLENNIKELEGTKYNCIVYPLMIKISTEEDRTEYEQREQNGGNEELEDIPATVIHLDNPAVEICEDKEFYLVYIKKQNMYVIPKSAFSADENDLIREKLSNIMGIRYKAC